MPKKRDPYHTQIDRIFLLRKFFLTQTSKNNPASRKQINEYLEHYGISITDRTFYNDLDMLGSHGMDMNIQYERKYFGGAGGYWLDNPPFTTDELRLIIDSIQSAKFITQATANKLSTKIKELASSSDAKYLDRPANVSNRITDAGQNVMKDADKIYDAIYTDSKISFRYFHKMPRKDAPRRYTRDGDRIIVSPVSLLWDNGNYYMYGYDGEKFKTYRVDRMDRIVALADRRSETIREKQTRSKAKVFDMYHGKEYNITFRCNNYIVDSVIDRFGNDVVLVPYDDSHFTFTAAVEVSPPFFAWIATFGRRIKVTNPPEVIKKMKEFLNKSAEMYQDE